MSALPRTSSRDLALVAIFAGIVAALAIVPGFTPPGFTVPITAQSLGVMLAGSVLGARRGALSLLLFLALVAVGLPLLTNGRGGLGVFVGTSAGFLAVFPVAAYVTGWISERAGTPYKLHWGLVANLVGGIVVMYIGGVVGLAAVLDISLAKASLALWVYIPGDLVKVFIAAVVARGVHAAYPGLLGRERRQPVKETSAV